MKTREEVIKEYKQACKDHGWWDFLPYNAICSCGYDFYKEEGESLGQHYTISGCPKCYKSYCE